MTEDLLERAAAVVRNRYDGNSANAAQAERSMLLALQARERRRSRAPLLALPLVAALLASAAWGSVSESTRASMRGVLHGLLPARVASAPSKRVRSPAGPPSAAPVVPPLLSVTTEPGAPSGPDAPPAAPISPPSRHASSKLTARPLATESPPETGPPVADEAEINALYRAAHHAQFSGSDAALTLTLWDRYLAAAPNGSLSPEARYNRAITLLRMGRNSEAASALEPFARGDYGAYRQTEANALLNSLRPAAPPR